MIIIVVHGHDCPRREKEQPIRKIFDMGSGGAQNTWFDDNTPKAKPDLDEGNPFTRPMKERFN